ncbi:hypothetical protein HM1_1973 [Heliomicrobium modesticaldum Ice1]|uniref:Uncharacterized protein n=1 Tax=Heliobacterium modesticaldum (strain ATCC 51547 / Ice1) TaxID=498761 RepID=B0TFV1_HELMI|nr:cytochrome c3 family protein [Heliomicrobium modesticaldum]ABZ84531.1 hypothetical protein HM1_1973 [Heliomicrobium modesticaldum Ice1]
MNGSPFARLLTLLIVVAFALVGYFALTKDQNPHGDLAEWERAHGRVVNTNRDPERFCYKCHTEKSAYCVRCHQQRGVSLENPLP